MIDWTARANAEIARHRVGATDKTDESRLLSVSSVGVTALFQQTGGLSSVLSVGVPAVLEKRTGINDGAGAAPRSSGNPYMTPDQGDACHEGGWDDQEIESFVTLADRFKRMGRPDAEHLAERLVLRDRDADGRRLCLECLELESSGRCAAARRGAIAGADRHLEPTPNILVNCGSFSAAPVTFR